MVIDDLQRFRIPSFSAAILVRRVTADQAELFAELFLRTFDMPLEYAPTMADLIRPSIGLPNVYHFMAWLDGKPVGICSLLCHQTFGVLGSAGVVTERRGSRVASNLAIAAARQALEDGVQTFMLQTTSGTWLERLLRISGFKRAFARTCYVLS